MPTLFIDPGALRHPVTLEQAVLADDGVGGHAETWEAVAETYAQIEPVSAEMKFGADQTLETLTHRITLRFRDQVASGMRFTKGARTFAILTVHDPDETGRFMVCRTQEVGR